MTVWATGGASDSAIGNVVLTLTAKTLTAKPATLKPTFSVGCVDSKGADKNGTDSCNLGTVQSGSPGRQLTAQAPIPANTASGTSAQLTVAATGTGITTKPQMSAPVAVTAPKAAPTPSKSPPPAGTTGSPAGGAGGAGGARGAAPPAPGISAPQPIGVSSTLPAGGFPSLGDGGQVPSLGPGAPGGTSLNPGGNASSLFPTVNPAKGRGATRPVADTLPGDASVMGAQYAGLAALVLAFVLSVTRLSIRRRQAAAAQNGPGSQDSPGEPD